MGSALLIPLLPIVDNGLVLTDVVPYLDAELANQAVAFQFTFGSSLLFVSAEEQMIPFASLLNDQAFSTIRRCVPELRGPSGQVRSTLPYYGHGQ